MLQKKYSDYQIIKRLLIIAKPYWLNIVGVFLANIIAIPLALLMPISLKIIVDSILSSSPLPDYIRIFLPDQLMMSKASLLWVAVGIQVGVVALSSLQSIGSYVLDTYTGEKLNLVLRGLLIRHVQRQSFAFHDYRGTSDSIYRIQYDSPSIQYIFIYGYIPLLSSLLTFFAMLYVIVTINPKLGLIALTVVPIIILLTKQYNRHMRPQYGKVKIMESGILMIIQEVLTAFREVKAFGREDREEQRFVSESRKTLNHKTRLSFYESLYGFGINLSTAIGTAAVLFIGVSGVLSNTMTLGELLIVIAYLSQLYGPLKSISGKVATLQSQLVSAHRVFDLLDEIPDVVEMPNAKHITKAKGKIEFKNISFSYDRKTMVLNNISFIIPSGSRVGIAGRTGAGKTTMISLLPRFYDPTEGLILLDDIDIRNYKLSDLRNQFAIVLQEPVLFSTTIDENIRYAKPEATDQEVIEAAKAANVHDFITTQPHGYSTLVGERGMRLSGGERQRISLARAFLKDAPILILDEPTSSVDTKTENIIMDAMDRLMKNRTTFMIAHRLSTLEKCEIRIELEEGQINSQFVNQIS